MNPEKQVGGDHYARMAIGPAEFIHRNGIGYLAGNAIKYLCRFQRKGGVQDLEKAKHYIEMLIDAELALAVELRGNKDKLDNFGSALEVVDSAL
jgi:hypothetical protein